MVSIALHKKVPVKIPKRKNFPKSRLSICQSTKSIDTIILHNSAILDCIHILYSKTPKISLYILKHENCQVFHNSSILFCNLTQTLCTFPYYTYVNYMYVCFETGGRKCNPLARVTIRIV